MMLTATDRTIIWESAIASATAAVVMYVIGAYLSWWRGGKAGTPEGWYHTHNAAWSLALSVAILYAQIVRYHEWCDLWGRVKRASAGGNVPT